MLSTAAEKRFLFFRDDYLTYEKPTANCTVFYDESNRQLFVLYNDGPQIVTTVKGPQFSSVRTFRLENRGSVTTIRFNPSNRILGVQRSEQSVEFINVVNGEVDKYEYSQSCQGNRTRILMFFWSNDTEVAFLTTNGFELYKLMPEKRILKSIRVVPVKINWHLWRSEAKTLLFASGECNEIFSAVLFSDGAIKHYPIFKVGNPVKRGEKSVLQVNDVSLVRVYNESYISVVCHASSKSSSLDLYQLRFDSQIRKTHSLQLPLPGCYALNVIDDLLVVHSQSAKMSMIFDIIVRTSIQDGVYLHEPIVQPLAIRPFRVTSYAGSVDCDMYSNKWILFYPNCIADSSLLCLWELALDLDAVIACLLSVGQPELLLKMLACRSNGHRFIVSAITQMVQLVAKRTLTLVDLRRAFDLVNEIIVAKSQIAQQRDPLFINAVNKDNIVDQSTMYRDVLYPLTERSGDAKLASSIIITYINSLLRCDIAVQHFLDQAILTKLLEQDKMHQLLQLIQHHVIESCEPTACSLLSVNTAEASQMALDMLKVRRTSEQIIDVLLAQRLVLKALRYAISISHTDALSARKFLEVARHLDDYTFYHVYRFFEERNLRLAGTSKFAPGDQCQVFENYFINKFYCNA